MKRSIALILSLTALVVTPAVAGTLHVPGDYAQIHDAVQACAAGDTVLVAAGTYNDCTHPTEGPESTPACVIMRSGVTLIGAGPDATILDAQGLGRGIFIEFVENCRVENLQVTGAFADIYGAGILIRNVGSTVSVTDCRVTLNGDGGVVCINEAHPVLTRLILDHNSAKQGGGLAVEENSSPQIVDCMIDTNDAPSGAGIFMRTGCSPTITGCTIINNVITAEYGNGGGIAVQNSSPTISDCNISFNSTLGYGGGVAFVEGASGSITDCLIQGNDAAGDYSEGGGLATSQSDPVVENLVIVDNECSGFYAEGGGIALVFSPYPSIVGCTIVGNRVDDGGGGSLGGGIYMKLGADANIERCIIAGSTYGQGIYCYEDDWTPPPVPVISCTNVWGNAGGDDLCGTDNGGNFSADPLFCGTVGSEYNLQATSPCAPGNHPGGLCDGALIGALSAGCGGSPAPLPQITGITLGNRPNPFNPRTSIFFELPQAGPAHLRIYDLAGRLVTQHSWDEVPAQQRVEFQWNGLNNTGRAVPSGVYLYRVDSRELSTSRRMSLVR